jgi:hypothetical protein
LPDGCAAEGECERSEIGRIDAQDATREIDGIGLAAAAKVRERQDQAAEDEEEHDGFASCVEGIERSDVERAELQGVELGLPGGPHETEVMEDDGEGGESAEGVKLVEPASRCGGHQANCSRKRMSPE